ncbi:MAG: hypothetical protein AABX38_02215 [Candidatus Micrarchaeota archaeon]
MEEVDELLDKLKECPAEQLELVVYAAVIEKLKITAEKIFDSYSTEEENPLEVKFLTRDALINELETEYGLVIRNLQQDIAKLIREAKQEKFSKSFTEKVFKSIERETWNYIYSKFIKVK